MRFTWTPYPFPLNFNIELNTLIYTDGKYHIHSQIVKSSNDIIGLSPPIFRVVSPKLVKIMEWNGDGYDRIPVLYRSFYIDVVSPPYLETFSWFAIPTEQIFSVIQGKNLGLPGYNKGLSETRNNFMEVGVFSTAGREGIPPEIKYSAELGIVKTPYDLRKPQGTHSPKSAQTLIIRSHDSTKMVEQSASSLYVQTTSSITIVAEPITQDEWNAFYNRK